MGSRWEPPKPHTNTRALLGFSRQGPVPQQSFCAEEMGFCQILASVYFTEAAMRLLCTHPCEPLYLRTVAISNAGLPRTLH